MVNLFSMSLMVTITAMAAAQDVASSSAGAATTRPARSAAREAAARAQEGLAEVARQVFPGIVTVRAYVKAQKPADASEVKSEGWGESAYNDDYPGFRMQSAGSGFFVDQRGDVLTCLHAIQNQDGSLVDLVDVELQNQTRIICEVVGTEPTVNLAILRCAVIPASSGAPFPVLAFGDSDAMEAGAWTIGVGDPAGPEKFFAIGTFVARPNRDCYQEMLSSFYMQTAMTAHPQAYGGPLVDLDGNVIGMLSPRSPSPGFDGQGFRFGVEFALPSKIVAGLYDSIRQAKSFRSPWLGFSVMSRAEVASSRGIESFNAMSKPRHGILIENVFQPSPASRAGIAPGDFLVSFDGVVIFAPVDFQKCMYLAGVGKTVKLELFRDGATITKEIAIEARPASAAPK